MPRPLGGRWIAQRSWIQVLEGETHALGLYIFRGFGPKPKYGVTAIETPRSSAPSLRAVVDNHAHMVIATNVPTLAEAKKKGNRYAKRWREVRKLADACACKDIDLRPKVTPADDELGGLVVELPDGTRARVGGKTFDAIQDHFAKQERR